MRISNLIGIKGADLDGQRNEDDSRRGFFLFASFSFFKTGCGNVGNSTGRPGPGYEYSNRPLDG